MIKIIYFKIMQKKGSFCTILKKSRLQRYDNSFKLKKSLNNIFPTQKLLSYRLPRLQIWKKSYLKVIVKVSF